MPKSFDCDWHRISIEFCPRRGCNQTFAKESAPLSLVPKKRSENREKEGFDLRRAVCQTPLRLTWHAKVQKKPQRGVVLFLNPVRRKIQYSQEETHGALILKKSKFHLHQFQKQKKLISKLFSHAEKYFVSVIIYVKSFLDLGFAQGGGNNFCHSFFVRVANNLRWQPAFKGAFRFVFRTFSRFPSGTNFPKADH